MASSRSNRSASSISWYSARTLGWFTSPPPCRAAITWMASSHRSFDASHLGDLGRKNMPKNKMTAGTIWTKASVSIVIGWICSDRVSLWASLHTYGAWNIAQERVRLSENFKTKNRHNTYHPMECGKRRSVGQDCWVHHLFMTLVLNSVICIDDQELL